MATTIWCPQCARDVSVDADRCPNCGYDLAHLDGAPTRVDAVPVPTSSYTPPPPSPKPQTRYRSCAIGCGTGGCLVFLLVMLVGFVLDQARSTQPVRPMPPQPPSGPLATQHVHATNTKWRTEELQFGRMAYVTVDVRNDNDFPVRDVLFNCEERSASGSMITGLGTTFYAIVPPHGTLRSPEMRIGRIHDQTASIRCEVINVMTH